MTLLGNSQSVSVNIFNCIVQSDWPQNETHNHVQGCERDEYINECYDKDENTLNLWYPLVEVVTNYDRQTQ